MLILKPGDVGTIFRLSVINGTDNNQHLLPVNGWKWPKSTWLQRRLEQIRKEQGK